MNQNNFSKIKYEQHHQKTIFIQERLNKQKTKSQMKDINWKINFKIILKKDIYKKDTIQKSNIIRKKFAQLLLLNLSNLWSESWT